MRKRKRIFFILRIVSLFFLGLIVALVVAVSKINVETIRRSVVSILENAVNAHVQIDGDVKWRMSLRPSLVLDKVTIANANWAKKKNVVDAKRIVVRLNLLSLFNKNLAIENATGSDLVVNIEQNAKGEFSLPMLNKTDAVDVIESTNKQAKYAFSNSGLGRVRLKNVKLNIVKSKINFNEKN